MIEMYESWIKKANRIGSYQRSRHGFRIYCTRQPQVHRYYEIRDDGKYLITDFIKGKYVAVNKSGEKIQGSSMTEIWDKIEVVKLIEYYK